jgi:hypothetical protein
MIVFYVCYILGIGMQEATPPLDRCARGRVAADSHGDCYQWHRAVGLVRPLSGWRALDSLGDSGFGQVSTWNGFPPRLDARVVARKEMYLYIRDTILIWHIGSSMWS